MRRRKRQAEAVEHAKERQAEREAKKAAEAAAKELAEEIKNASPSQPPIGGSSPEGGAPGVPVTSTVNE